jgi:hypothetical protein
LSAKGIEDIPGLGNNIPLAISPVCDKKALTPDTILA